MNAKVTFVRLRCKAGATLFELAHAERLLNYRDNGGWVLDDDKFELKNGSLIRRSAKSDNGKKGR